MLVPVILSGGSGTRLWPRSRRLHPKQLQALVGEHTMLQQTVARIDGLPDVAAPLVVCSDQHGELVRTQLGAMGRPPSAVVLEPMGRSTAPAVALAALVARARHAPTEPTLLCLPADHVVRDPAAFRAAVELGVPLAEAGRLVTFGIVPDQPHTGYGYIRAATSEGPESMPQPRSAPMPVEAFVEKPDRATAERYLQAGGYYWNSGMFLLRADAFLAELGVHAPRILAACERALAGGTDEPPLVHLDAEAFASCPSDSIDYAVMEKTSRASVVPLSAGWSDVGSWAALHEVGPLDEAGNRISGDVQAIDCEGSSLVSGHRLVAAIGLRDTVVVETEDAVLVMPRRHSERVKEVVDYLRAHGRSEATEPVVRTHPWGTARRLEDGTDTGLWSLRMRPAQSVPRLEGSGWRRLVVTAGGGQLQGPPEQPARALGVGDTAELAAETGYELVAGPDGLTLLLLEPPATRTDS